jgi:hypothetical protein
LFGKKQALLQSLWSVDILRTAHGPGVPAGVMRFEVQRLFGDFFESGRILGGDVRYIFLGSYKIEDYRLTGTLDVVRYAGEPEAAWGDRDNPRFTLAATLEPDLDRDVFRISAEPADGATASLTLRLTRRARLD